MPFALIPTLIALLNSSTVVSLIEKATPLLVPLQSRSRVGYVFKGELGLA